MDHIQRAIEKKAYLSRKDLKEITIPESVEEVGDWAFAYCDELRNVNFLNDQVRFGKAVFLECNKLKRIRVEGKSKAVARLLAAAVTVANAPYLLDLREAGSKEWFAKWDARMLTILHTPDDEGYSKQVLCGEEDYGSTDYLAYCSGRRKEKVRLLFIRLLYDEELNEDVKMEMAGYILAHTKNEKHEEAWQVLLEEFGEERAYYELFAQLGCVTKDNLQDILEDIGDANPEMKAYFLRVGEGILENDDVFGDLLI